MKTRGSGPKDEFNLETLIAAHQTEIAERANDQTSESLSCSDLDKIIFEIFQIIQQVNEYENFLAENMGVLTESESQEDNTNLASITRHKIQREEIRLQALLVSEKTKRQIMDYIENIREGHATTSLGDGVLNSVKRFLTKEQTKNYLNYED